jgi:hypothetical protein
MAQVRKKTTNKPTAKFGGLKRSKPTWKFGLIALIAVLVLTSAGYVGYGKYKEHTLKAHAAGYKLVFSDNTGFGIWGCKTNINSVYGPLTSVNLLFNRGNTYSDANYSVMRPVNNFTGIPKFITDKHITQWWGGTTAFANGILLSPSLNDYLVVYGINYPYVSGGSFQKSNNLLAASGQIPSGFWAVAINSWPAC